MDDATRTITIAWLSGGTLGVVYTLTNQITTAAGRAEVRSMSVLVREL